MKCPIESQDNAGVLLAYCAGRLDSATSADVAEHIHACPACRQFARSQQEVWKALDAWEAVPISVDFDRRLYRRIEEQSRLSLWERLVQPFRPVLARQGLPIAATVCLLLMAGMLVERPRQIKLPEEPQAQIEAIQPDQVDRTLEDIEMLREFSQIVRHDARPNAM